MRIVIFAMISAMALAGSPVAEVPGDLRVEFAERVLPFLSANCVPCHGDARQEAQLNLRDYASVEGVICDLPRWTLVLERLETGEMPPQEAEQQPSEEQRRGVIEWIKQLRRYEARRMAGDPGPTLVRRLSNAEYDYTVRDLTGVDIRPTREFPIDPATQEGFDNSGESLTMSPALLTKYLAAARHVADHLLLTPDGLAFAPHPVVTDTDRDKYCVQRIIDFYGRQRIDYADYFAAAWRYRHRAALGNPQTTWEDVASAAGVSSKYLATTWTVLEDTADDAGPLGALRRMWRDLPAPELTDDPRLRDACVAMRDFVQSERNKLHSPVEFLKSDVIAPGSQPMVLWVNRRLAAQRLRPGDADLPDDPLLRDGVQRFCSTFPDAVLVSERGRMYLAENPRNKGRLLSAGFHLMVGYYRDDRPLYDLFLSDVEQQELDRLWEELNFISAAPVRQFKDFIYFERAESPNPMRGAEFDFARSEDPDVTSEPTIRSIAERYVQQARDKGLSEDAVEAVSLYFEEINGEIRRVEQARLDAVPAQLEALADFAERAYRRPLSAEEREKLLAFYHAQRDEQNLSHEDALRDAVVSVLMSPHVCYRLEMPAPGAAVGPVSDYELANRLSYFLWASMPDEELLSHAAEGTLHHPEVLAAQTRRMIGDSRIEGFAREFAGHWLDFRRFEQHNSVDRERFPAFNDELRQAMFEEPLRFFIDLVRRDGSIFEFLVAEHTFVNPVLAAHYGMLETSPERPHDWMRLNDARRYGRGGLLPMAVFLTQNAPGLRTSPVKRGYWVVRQLLGERIPPPPPEVPELPKDEADLGSLTLREVLEQHRAVQSCAVCHARFDTLGLMFEGYGPIGERRDVDLGGRQVDTHATLPGGIEATGLDGLRQYLREHRQQEFVENLCRKLLSYALGRSLQISDDLLLEDMQAHLAAEDYRFGILVEAIATSPQFLNKRGLDDDSNL